MTKWVTFLLLLLALLAYGLSQMRPVPVDGPTGATATPVAVATTVPVEPTPDQPKPAPDSPATPKAPKFGPPPVPKASQTPAVAATPKAPAATGTPVASNGVKPDPFSTKIKKPPAPVVGTIKATTLSDSLGGPSLTKFPASTEAIYMTATPEGLDDNVDVVASYRSILDEEADFSTPSDSSGPPRKRVFRLSTPEDGWKTGPYQVVLKAKGTDSVVGITRFEVLDPEATLPESMPEPEYMDLVPDLEAETKAQSSFSSRDGKVLLRVAAPDLPAGTDMRTVWSALEVDRLTSGELIAVSNQAAPGPGKDAVFTYEAPPGGFHSGSYKVDVYFDQVLVGSQVFFVEPPKPKKP
jgi:hypothetical protein